MGSIVGSSKNYAMKLWAIMMHFLIDGLEINFDN
jgi:hypothetical protein